MLSISIFYLTLVIHVLSAIAWLGGLTALDFVFIPSLISNESTITGDFVRNTSKRYALITQVASLLLLLTGITLTFDLGYLDVNKLFQTVYGHIILVKVSLYLIFAILGAIGGNMLLKLDDSITKEALLPLLRKARNILVIDLSIGVIIVILAISLAVNVQLTL